MIPIEEAKDLILLNYANWVMKRLNFLEDQCVRLLERDELSRTVAEEMSELLDRIYLVHRAQIQMAAFEYWEAVENDQMDSHKNLIRFYHKELRERIIDFNDLIRAHREFGIPAFEDSVYARAVVAVDGKIDKTIRHETKSKRKKTEGRANIVFFDDAGYYELLMPKESGGFEKIETIPYYVPRYVPF